MAKLLSVDVREVVIGDRVRKLVGDVKKKQNSSDIRDMANSLEENGQIQPIVLNGNELIAGFRRLTGAAILLSEGKSIGFKLPEQHERRQPPGKILAVQYNDMTPREKLQMEMEENIARKDFTNPEKALGYERLKQLMEQVEGRTVTTKEVAKAAGVSRAQVTMGLKVAEAINKEGKTHLLQSSSVIAAYNRLNSENKIAELKERAKGNKAQVAKKDNLEKLLFNGNALDHIKTLPNESIDFINFDPPWGIDIDSYDRWNMYEEVSDDEATVTFKTTIRPLIPELYRVLKNDTYMVVWFGMQFYNDLVTLLERAGGKDSKGKPIGFKVRPVPSIWNKINKAGSQADSSRIELNCYEPFLICEKGSPRLFKKAQRNVLSYPMPTQRIHYTQKDVDLQVDILERYTFGNMVCYDPTFGSGSFLRACQRLGRPFMGCEKNAENYKKALEWLRIGVIQ